VGGLAVSTTGQVQARDFSHESLTELWDEAEMTKKYYEKCMELLEKDRGKICEKLEKTNKAADRIRVTEIYQNGELVSRNEEAL